MRGLFLRRVFPALYTITFDGNGGTASAVSLKTGADGKLASLPTATRDDYTFLGWYLSNGTQVTTDTVFTEDTILYAQWKQNTATVTVTGSGDVNYCYLTINGVKVVRAGTYEVIPGDTVSCYASNRYTGHQGRIMLNGSTVVFERPASLNYEVTGNVTIYMGSYTDPAYEYRLWEIKITE